MLGELLDGARVVSARRGKVAVDRETWRRLVGDRVARRTEPGGLSAGVLTIYVASAPWAQELSMLSDELMERLKPLKLGMQSLRFRIRQEISGPPKAPKRSPAARAAIPSELRERLDCVDDPELRALIADAAELWLGRQAKLSAKSAAQAPRAAGVRSDRTAKDQPPRPATSPSNPETGPGRRR